MKPVFGRKKINPGSFTTRTFIVYDRNVMPLNFSNTYEALGAIDSWMAENVIVQQMQSLLSLVNNYPPLPISVKFNGDDTTDIIAHDPYEAYGFCVAKLQPSAMEYLDPFLLSQVNGHKKIPGHIVFHDGGEITYHDFTHPYQAVGFLAVMLSEYQKKTFKYWISNKRPINKGGGEK